MNLAGSDRSDRLVFYLLVRLRANPYISVIKRYCRVLHASAAESWTGGVGGVLPWKQQRMMCDETERMALCLAHSSDYGIYNAEGNRISHDLIIAERKWLRGV